jgi:starch phosphorylase
LQLGAEISIRAYVALGDLQSDDVIVEAVYGRVDADDVLVEPRHAVMVPVEGYDGNRWQFSVNITMDHNGPFGYTVRVLPSHAGLASPTEMGLRALPLNPTP